jgi:hypothetical protein
MFKKNILNFKVNLRLYFKHLFKIKSNRIPLYIFDYVIYNCINIKNNFQKFILIMLCINCNFLIKFKVLLYK